MHGFACDHTDWSAQIDFLSKTREVVACDLRGHGETPGRAQECTIEHYGGDVLALVNNLELENPILVGHSMGCRVVLEANLLLSSHAPERASGLILIDGSRQGSGDAAQAEALTRSAILASGYEKFAENVFRQMFFTWTAQADAALARMKRMPAETGIALWTSMVRWDVTRLDAALAAVRAPLRVIQSTWINAERKRLPLKTGETSPWLDFLRNKTGDIHIVSGVGHFPQLEAPERVNRLVAEFGR